MKPIPPLLPLALLATLALSGCFLRPDPVEIDTSGVPYTPFVRIHSYVQGEEETGEFRVSRDAANFTWTVEFGGVSPAGQETCLGVPEDMPRVELTDPTGRVRKTVSLPAPTVGAPADCGAKVQESFERMDGMWRVRITGRGDVLGTAAAS